jgi:hypothetical protein
MRAAGKGNMTRTFAALALLYFCTGGVSFAQAVAAPDDTLTPGALRTGALHAKRPTTPAAVVVEIERRYRVSGVHDPSCGAGRCEIDHRIPWGCLGASTADNLWFQAFGDWQRKDRLEHWAERQVTLGHLTVEACQEMFREPNDWRDRYRIVFRRDP